MAAWTTTLSDIFQVWQKHQGRDKSIECTRKWYLPILSDLRTFPFNMLLTADTATNFNNMHLCIPLQIKKNANTANDIDDNLKTVNNFSLFIKEINIRRYNGNIIILPTNKTVDIYRYVIDMTGC